MRSSLDQLAKKHNKACMEAKQRQTRDSGRLQALQEQVAQLQNNVKLTEAAWVEKRRAEQAAATQRERNLQTAI
eukprot:969425-Prymnesium_polylepis.1